MRATHLVDPSLALAGPPDAWWDAVKSGTVDLWWLNRALVNLAEDPKNWAMFAGPNASSIGEKDPRRTLAAFQHLVALPLAGGIGAARGIVGRGV